MFSIVCVYIYIRIYLIILLLFHIDIPVTKIPSNTKNT